jgi:septum formation protein
MNAPPVVLASASAGRAAILTNAGVAFTVDATHVDEDAVKQAMRGDGASAADVAQALAELKAVRKSLQHPGALVIGADQMLDCDGEWFDKPAGRLSARTQLEALSGRTHTLHSAVCVAREGAMIWHYRDRADLTMRVLSEDFLSRYFAEDEAALTGSVGGYRLEGKGAQLFNEIRGDYFSILGLPLLPLLAFLREHGVLVA